MLDSTTVEDRQGRKGALEEAAKRDPESPAEHGSHSSVPASPVRPAARSPHRRAGRYALALLSGALLACCFPGPDQGWLVWIALVPLFAAFLGNAPREQAISVGLGARLGIVVGAVFLGGLLSWVWIFGWYAWLALTVYQALWLALFGALAAALLRRTPALLAPPTLAAAWTLLEWLRGMGSLGLTWGDLAVSQHRTLPVLQMLDWTGPFGLTFLIALVNASLAAVLMEGPARGSAWQQPAGRRWLASAILVVGVLTARGSWLLAQPGERGSAVPVAVIQGNIDQDTDWDDRYLRRSMGAYTRLTQAAARAGARLVVWPETALPGELRSDPALEAEVEALARATGAELIVGSNDHSGECAYNRAFLIDRQGHVRGHYAKRHLVPYGECVPLGAWLPFMNALHVRPFNLTPGDGFFPMYGETHRWGTVICFESAFPAIARAMARHGAELLIEISDDTWFGRSAAAAQHAAMAPLRAVETRRAFARATATGISTLVDDRGRVRRRLGLFREGYLLDRLPLRRDLTLYTRLGDWPVLLSLLLCLAALRPRRAP